MACVERLEDRVTELTEPIERLGRQFGEFRQQQD
jgi:hypothetical protein